MKRQWIKLYIEILDDPKMGRLSAQLWRRAVEIFLVAGEVDRDGILPSVDEMAWRLRIRPEQLTEDLQSLAGIVEWTESGWLVSKFKDRQFSESYERVKRYRNAKSNADGNADVAKKESSSPSTSNSYSEGGGAGEGTNPLTVPATPRQAMANPYIQAYQKITGGFPGERDYSVIIDTFRYLEDLHGEKYTEYLMPYWIAWSTRKTKDGVPYKKNSRVWYCEWAMQGDIPKANGHEPQMNKTWTPVPSVEETRKMIEKREEEWKKSSKPVNQSIAKLAGKMSPK